MRSTHLTAIKMLAVFGLAVSIPSFANGQAGARGGGAGAAGGGMNVAQQLQQVLGQLDLTTDQKSKIKGIMTEAQQSMRESLQGLQDATPEERQAKMQDVQKLMTQTRDKVEGELTTEQKAKFNPLMARASLKRLTDLVAAIKTAAGKMEIKDDDKKQLTNILNDSDKTLDGYKGDADAVTDAAGAADFAQKLTKFQLDLRKQVMDVLGQEDGQKLMQDARATLRPTAGAGRAKKENAPTTEPAAK